MNIPNMFGNKQNPDNNMNNAEQIQNIGKNLNLDQGSIDNIKNMVGNQDMSQILSQISPEMIQNFSNMMNNNSNSTSKSNNQDNSNNNDNFNNNSNFDLSNMDMQTMMKITQAFKQMNNGNNSRSNLINSLKPYLRSEKQGKLDQYSNLMNIAKMAELFKDNKGDV